MDDRVFVRAGQTVEPEVDRLDPHTEVRTQALPSEDSWAQARPLAQAVFGIDASPMRNAASVSALIGSLKEQAEARRDSVNRLASEIGQVPASFRAPESAPRRRTAAAGAKLLRDLLAAKEADAVGVLAGAEVPTSPQALGRSIKTAEDVVAALKGTNWTLLESAVTLGGKWQGRAGSIQERVRTALECDELTQPLSDVLREEDRAATLLLSEATAGARKPQGGDEGGEITVDPKISLEEVRSAANPQEAREVLAEIEAGERKVESIQLRVRYRS